MRTIISIPSAAYNRAKAFAEEQDFSIDELFVALIGKLTLKSEDAAWNVDAEEQTRFSQAELVSRIEEGEREFDHGEYKSHEQLMSDLIEEFPWLQ